MANAACAAVGAVVVPLTVEVQWRADPTRHAAGALHRNGASEIVVTEGAARHSWTGATLTPRGSPRLSSRAGAEHPRALPVPARDDAFGLPRALVPHTPWSDARLFFLLVTAAAAVLASRRWRAPPEHRLRALQVLLVLPTGAAVIVTGGDDVPVLALCLLALVLFDRGRHAASAAAATGAALMKLTAWPLLLVLAVPSRRARVALAAAAGGVLVAAAASPADFADDVLLFPTGLTKLPSPAATTTLGSVMIAPVGDSSPYRVVLTLALLAVAVLLTAFVLLALARRGEVGAPEAAPPRRSSCSR